MSNLKSNSDEYTSNRKSERSKRKAVFDFYKKNYTLIDKIWWDILVLENKIEIYYEYEDYYSHTKINGTPIDKRQFFIDMKKQYDRTQQIRDIKIAKIIMK